MSKQTNKKKKRKTKQKKISKIFFKSKILREFCFNIFLNIDLVKAYCERNTFLFLEKKTFFFFSKSLANESASTRKENIDRDRMNS